MTKKKATRKRKTAAKTKAKAPARKVTPVVESVAAAVPTVRTRIAKPGALFPRDKERTGTVMRPMNGAIR